ncbi:hypothetical protein JYK14_25480 [Siccirubricoccus sp. KC 17139]|uniref:Uncharacterized protein n=1 Tax=Siccirubricoccus soli TaxID=2899147 RepID=A0ABT1DEU6_9PROT|nr:hypothetical protein [Siccirubricoccus soli]MCO6419490.1 hypothetical protein [Siccirubricoccus soli]MCP2685625.1 hypothetical protein [Siccirubricoccus soli]
MFMPVDQAPTFASFDVNRDLTESLEILVVAALLLFLVFVVLYFVRRAFRWAKFHLAPDL